MKKVFKTIIISIAMVYVQWSMVQAQAPQSIPYQAVARNTSGSLIANQTIAIRFAIHDGTAAGATVYTEVQHPTTNTLGLFSVNIGVITPASFALINWASGAKFMQVEIDITNGTAFVDMGTQQMMSVPYALYAASSSGGSSNVPNGTAAGIMLYWNGSAWVNLPAGQPGQYMQVGQNNIPAWVSPQIPTLTTTAVTYSTSYAAALSGGTITSDGALPIAQKGVCWSLNPNPTTALPTKTNDGSGSTAFSSTLTGLALNTLYYVRAYAINDAGTGYGNEVTFTTQNGIPTLGTTTASNIGAVSAWIEGNVLTDGGVSISARGICWSTSPNPTIANNSLAIAAGTGTINFNVNSLLASTTYYLRVYATNATGSYYSNEVTFTTLDGIATLTTIQPTSVTAVGAISGGDITYDGGGQIIQRGVCWSTSTNPTTALPTKTNDGVNAGIFFSNITGLAPSTTYYVRAYATNFATTTYGNEYSFTTQNGLVTLTTTAASCTKDVTSISGGNITADGGGPITARGVCWSINPNPSTALSTKTSNGTGTGAFTSNITALTHNTTYYVRAYAVNAAGTFYGNQITLTTALHYVGESFGGGIVVYIDCTGQHGIISATSNVTTFFVDGAPWYNNSYLATGATGTAIGTGQANTTAIVAAQGAGIYAAQACNDYVSGGFNDWYLPSQDELLILKSLGNIIGGFTNEFYWSSTQVSGLTAYAKALDYAFGTMPSYSTEHIFRVRPVRSF